MTAELMKLPILAVLLIPLVVVLAGIARMVRNTFAKPEPQRRPDHAATRLVRPSEWDDRHEIADRLAERLLECVPEGEAFAEVSFSEPEHNNNAYGVVSVRLRYTGKPKHV